MPDAGSSLRVAPFARRQFSRALVALQLGAPPSQYMTWPAAVHSTVQAHSPALPHFLSFSSLLSALFLVLFAPSPCP